MPTDISNAVGTARQFTPQPDNTYQGHYQVVNAISSASSASADDVMELAQNMSRLDSALQGYAISHEKYLDTVGHNQAERMVNSMTPDDVEKLNMIDAAQQYGYADSAANPYFKAYAEKLRGGFLSAKMKQEYDAKYNMSPSYSADEEMKRYADFSSTWKEEHLSGNNAPSNKYSFDMGFNESQLINANQLVTDWNKKKNEDDVTVAMAAVSSNLGKLIENSVNILQTKDLMTDLVKKELNPLRLMGLPFAYKQKLVNDFASQLVQTGHLDANRLEQMMQNIPIQAKMDGTIMSAADILNMQDFKTAAAEFNKQFMTQEKYNIVQDAVKRKDMPGFLKFLEDKKKSDPDNAPAYAALTGAVDSGIKNKEAEERAIAREKQRQALSEQKNKQKSQIASDTINDVLTVWVNGGTMLNGQPISSYKFKSEEIYPAFMNELTYCVQEQDFNTVARLMSLPQAQEMRKTISDDMQSHFDLLHTEDDGSINLSALDQGFVKLFMSNSNSCESLFGAKVATKARILQNLIEMNGGDFQAGLKMFINYNTTDEAAKNEYAGQVQSLIDSTGFTVEAASNLGGGTDTIPIWGEADMESYTKDLATAFCCQGLSPDAALSKAGNIIQKGFTTYHWGYFPKGLMNDLGTTDDEVFFKNALDDAMCSITPDGDNSNVKIRYNRTSQVFYFSDIYTGNSGYKSLDYIKQAAKEAYATATAEQFNYTEETNDYDTTPEEINANRQTIGSTDMSGGAEDTAKGIEESFTENGMGADDYDSAVTTDKNEDFVKYGMGGRP